MIPHVTKGRSMRGLIGYLYGAGRHNEHTDQHAIASSGALWIEWGGLKNGEDARNPRSWSPTTGCGRHATVPRPGPRRPSRVARSHCRAAGGWARSGR